MKMHILQKLRSILFCNISKLRFQLFKFKSECSFKPEIIDFVSLDAKSGTGRGK